MFSSRCLRESEKRGKGEILETKTKTSRESVYSFQKKRSRL